MHEIHCMGTNNTNNECFVDYYMNSLSTYYRYGTLIALIL